MSKWLQEKQMTAFEVTYQGKKRTCRRGQGRIAARPARLGCGRTHQLPRRGERHPQAWYWASVSSTSPEYPTFSVLVTEANRKQLIGNALRALAAVLRTKDAIAVLDALEVLDGDRIDPPTRYAQEVLNRLKAKGPRPGAQPQRTLTGHIGCRVFRPIKYRLEPDLLVTVLGVLVIPATSCCRSPATRSTPASWCNWPNVRWKNSNSSNTSRRPGKSTSAVLRALFELFDLPSGLAQKATARRHRAGRRLAGESQRAGAAACSRQAPICNKGKLGFGARTCCAKKKPKTGMPGWIH